jgi:hypothetical protein
VRITKTVYAILLGLCVLATCCFDACWPVPQPGTPAGGFPVTTQEAFVDSAGNPITSSLAVPGMAVTGVWLSDGTGAAGSATNFSVLTDDNGNAFVNNGRVNANWSSAIGWNNPECGASSAYFFVTPLVGVPWLCPIVVDTVSGNSSTHFVLPGAVPSTITSYGDFSTTYGEPQLRVYVGPAPLGLFQAFQRRA